MTSGILVVDKPAGPTSHDIVQRARGLLRTKVGHTGTLDPLATGILPLVLGRATRLTRFFQGVDKEYLADVHLGIVTDTLDGEGRITAENSVPLVSPEAARSVLAQFTGNIQQKPPMYSAIKVAGTKLYELARRQLKRKRPLRSVSIYHIDLLEQEEDIWRLRIHCSSGTYIRSLANDIGQSLGCGAYLKDLRRIRSGQFDFSRAVRIEELARRWKQALYPLEELLPEFPQFELDDKHVGPVTHGTELPFSETASEEFYRLFHNHKLIAIGQVRDAKIHPIIVVGTAKLQDDVSRCN